MSILYKVGTLRHKNVEKKLNQSIPYKMWFLCSSKTHNKTQIAGDKNKAMKIHNRSQIQRPHFIASSIKKKNPPQRPQKLENKVENEKPTKQIRKKTS